MAETALLLPIIRKAQSLKSVQVPKDKLSKVSKTERNIKGQLFKGEPSPRQSIAYPFNFHLPSGLSIVLAEVGYYLNLICIMHYLYPASLANIFTYISLSGRPSGATSSRWALLSPSSFLLCAAMLAEVCKSISYKFLWQGFGSSNVSPSADATKVSKNCDTHAFIPLVTSQEVVI